MKIKKIMAVLGGVLLLGLAACGSPKNAKQLKKEAERQYGPCTIVSEEKSEKGTKLVLHDELQDFDYTYTSYMSEINIDGTSFGSLPSSGNNFEVSLYQKVTADHKQELDSICEKNGCTWQVNQDELLVVLMAPDEGTAKKVATEIAKILEPENKKNRLDGKLIMACGNKEADWWHNDRYGSVKLPDIKWRTTEDERVDEYIERAHMFTDPKAEYIRTEKKTFRDTGAELNRVVSTLGDTYPTDMNSPVTFYYFRSEKGQEYYICDFLYYDEDHYEYNWYTTYK